MVAEHANFHVLFCITAAGGALSLLATVAIVAADTNRAGGRVDIPGALLMSGGLVALLLPSLIRHGVLRPGPGGVGLRLRVIDRGGGALPAAQRPVHAAARAGRRAADRSIGANRTLSIGAAIVAAGWLERIFVTGSLWEVVLGSTIVGAGAGIGYASMPALINANTPPTELAAASGLHSLARSLGSSLASAVGGSLLTASTVVIAGAALPSLDAYRSLFAACAAVAVLAAGAALFVPHEPQAAELASPA